jgi:hypothetical protein
MLGKAERAGMLKTDQMRMNLSATEISYRRSTRWNLPESCFRKFREFFSPCAPSRPSFPDADLRFDRSKSAVRNSKFPAGERCSALLMFGDVASR